MNRARMFKLSDYALPGSVPTKRAHIRRSKQIVQSVYERWRVGPWSWQPKHALWFLQHGISGLSDQTRYDYWRTLRVIIVVIDKEAWIPRLQGGTWISPQGKRHCGTGGRPAKLPNRAGIRVRGNSTPAEASGATDGGRRPDARSSGAS